MQWRRDFTLILVDITFYVHVNFGDPLLQLLCTHFLLSLKWFVFDLVEGRSGKRTG